MGNQAKRLYLPLTLLWCAVAQTQNSHRPIRHVDFSDPEGIIHQLAPENFPPPVLAIRASERARTIQMLLEAKRSETGWHRELAVYFLICLGQDYEQNRNALLRAWESTRDEDTMALIIRIYQQGHSELLKTIIKAAIHSDGALSEELGDFFGSALRTQPRKIILAISEFPVQDQAAICSLAGSGDGGGMAADTEARVLRNLATINGKVAARCALSVRNEGKGADATNQ
jgi:hypothetical protein